MFTDNSEIIDSNIKKDIECDLKMWKILEERDCKLYNEFMKGFYDLLEKNLEKTEKQYED